MHLLVGPWGMQVKKISQLRILRRGFLAVGRLRAECELIQPALPANIRGLFIFQPEGDGGHNYYVESIIHAVHRLYSIFTFFRERNCDVLRLFAILRRTNGSSPPSG